MIATPIVIGISTKLVAARLPSTPFHVEFCWTPNTSSGMKASVYSRAMNAADHARRRSCCRSTASLERRSRTITATAPPTTTSGANTTGRYAHPPRTSSDSIPNGFCRLGESRVGERPGEQPHGERQHDQPDRTQPREPPPPGRRQVTVREQQQQEPGDPDERHPRPRPQAERVEAAGPRPVGHVERVRAVRVHRQGDDAHRRASTSPASFAAACSARSRPPSGRRTRSRRRRCRSHGCGLPSQGRRPSRRGTRRRSRGRADGASDSLSAISPAAS